MKGNREYLLVGLMFGIVLFPMALIMGWLNGSVVEGLLLGLLLSVSIILTGLALYGVSYLFAKCVEGEQDE